MVLINKEDNTIISFSDLQKIVAHNSLLKIGSTEDYLLLYISMYGGEIKFYSQTFNLDNIRFVLRLYGVSFNKELGHTHLSNDEFSDLLGNLIVNKQTTTNILKELGIDSCIYFEKDNNASSFLLRLKPLNQILYYK
jgi:hypothetical protein